MSTWRLHCQVCIKGRGRIVVFRKYGTRSAVKRQAINFTLYHFAYYIRVCNACKTVVIISTLPLLYEILGEQIPAPATRCHEACKKPVLTGQTLREVERGVIILSYWVRVSHAVFILTILSIIFHDYV